MKKNTQKEIHLKSRPSGVPAEENFKLVESAMPELEAEEVLVENEWMSVDPYMRGRMNEGDSYVPAFEIGEPLQGGCVGRVIQSNNDTVAEGEWVLSQLGWRRFWKSDGSNLQRIDAEAADPQSYLGVLGLTGMTAYVGLLQIGNLQEGETVFVSAASGAVGSVVCQIARIKNCRVISSAGSQEKIEWLQEKAGVDEVFNYKEVDNVSAKLAELCPDGIDLYYDNVGGNHLEAAIDNMNDFGRIVCCGMISGYNDESPQPGPKNLIKVIGKRLRMQGFIVRDHQDVQESFREEMSEWIKAGKIKWEETVTEGLENAPKAFIELFSGDKMGKALVRL